MNRLFSILIAAALLPSASALFAGTAYKCVSASGEVSFQQTVCDSADKETMIEMKSSVEPGEVELDAPIDSRLYRLYQYEQWEREQDAINARPGRSEEEKALEHLRNRRASQMGITRKELDRREGWKPRAQ